MCTECCAACAGQLVEWLGSHLAAAAAAVQLPTPALGRLSLSRADLHAHMAGEPIPRVAHSIDASLHLGAGYDNMRLALTGAPHVCQD